MVYLLPITFALLHLFLPCEIVSAGQQDAGARQALFEQALQRGAAHLQRGEKKLALAELKKAVALDTNSAAAHQLLGQAYLLQNTYEAMGEAKAVFVLALALDPNLICASPSLPRTYLYLRHPRKAQQQFQARL